jgi:chemotaxis protein methyltransferase CheR
VAAMTAEDFDYVRELVRAQCALVLESGKQYLVETRLAPLVRQHQFGSLSDLIARLKARPYNGLHTQVVEAMVTTETSFFRDHLPFESLRKSVIPELMRLRAAERRLCFWCAASSSGQEPYSLALLLRDSFPELAAWDVKLIASDVSTEMLRRCREGRYSQLEVNRGLPAALLVKYFTQHGVHWQLNDDVRGRVEFREINLSRPWPMLPRMDLVMLRNVMIYFDVPTKKDILGRVARLLRPGGYLVLGGAETTFNLDDSYRRVEQLKSGFYQQTS